MTNSPYPIRHMYAVTLLWRHKPAKGRPAHYTATGVVLAENAREAAEAMTRTLSTDGDVDTVRVLPKHTIGVQYGEAPRRTKGDRWDGNSPSTFLPMHLDDSGVPRGEGARWRIGTTQEVNA